MLKTSTLLAEGAYKTSKLLKVPVLLESEEMKDLLDALGEVLFFETGGIFDKEKGILNRAEFIALYAEYIESLKKCVSPEIKKFASSFSSAMSISPDLLYSVSVDEKRHIIKARKPVIQLTLNQIQYSKEDNSFRSMVYGEGAITWGVQFSYPQIYQNPHTQEILDVDESPEFPNTAVFHTLQKWIRHNSMATPFIVEGVRINVPIRLGKKCFSWINNHPDLVKKGIKVRALP
jgi:hypothetical protein